MGVRADYHRVLGVRRVLSEVLERCIEGDELRPVAGAEFAGSDPQLPGLAVWQLDQSSSAPAGDSSIGRAVRPCPPGALWEAAQVESGYLQLRLSN